MSTVAKELLIVGGNLRNQELLTQFIERLGHQALRADSLAALDQILAENHAVRFALVDITGFDQGIWERCTSLHRRDIPLLVISPRQSAAVTKLSFAHGAQSIMVKPLVMRELAEAIRGFMEAAA